VGGLLDANCNPGAATPEMLHRIYAPRAAVSANPVLLRELNGCGGGGAGLHVSGGGTVIGNHAFIGNLSPGERMAERESLLAPYMRGQASQQQQQVAALGRSAHAPTRQMPAFQPTRRRADSPPRGHFHTVHQDHLPIGLSLGLGNRSGVSAGACSARCVTTSGIQLTMDSLRMGSAGAGGGGGVGGRCKVHPR